VKESLKSLLTIKGLDKFQLFKMRETRLKVIRIIKKFLMFIIDIVTFKNFYSISLNSIELFHKLKKDKSL